MAGWQAQVLRHGDSNNSTGQDSNNRRVVRDAKSHTSQGYKTNKMPCVKWASERVRQGSTEIRASLSRILHTRRETVQHQEHEGRDKGEGVGS